jgi:hypothetical protein
MIYISQILQKLLSISLVLIFLSSCSGISAGTKFLRSLGIGVRAAKNTTPSSKWYHSFKSSRRNFQRMDDFQYFIDINEEKDKKFSKSKQYNKNPTKSFYLDIPVKNQKGNNSCFKE